MHKTFHWLKGKYVRITCIWKDMYDVIISSVFAFKQWLLTAWVKYKKHDSSYLSGVERYFCFSNRFSRPMSCSSVKTVRLLLPFFVLFPPSPPGSSLLRRWRSSGKWWEPELTCRPGVPDRRADPRGAPRGHESDDMGNLRIFACSFKTEKEVGNQVRTATFNWVTDKVILTIIIIIIS